MKAKDVQVGQIYIAKVSNRLAVVRVTGTHQSHDGKTRYDIFNTQTGRKTVFRSAAKIIRPALDQEKNDVGAFDHIGRPGPKSVSDLFRF